MSKHLITPPPELVQQWMQEASGQPPGPDARVIATLAARWGADQELEACKEWVSWRHSRHESDELLFARRPKPPSLKEQALTMLNDASDRLDAVHENTIRRALESLPD